MRIAVLSDVHANIDALQAVLRDIEERDIDALACLGDIVGYGGAPQACCDAIRTRARWAVLGNHDAAVAGRMNYEYYYSAARDALDLHRTQLDETNLRWLQELPMAVRESGMQFTHGRPDNPGAFEYMFNDDHAETLLGVYADLEPVNFIGHSHLTASFRFHPNESPGFERVSPPRIVLDPESRYVITVGSAGQPRDHNPRVCYVIYDQDAASIEFHRVAYDVKAAALRIWKQDALSAEFAKRLYLGS